VTRHCLLWAVSRLGYDRRGWKFQTLTAVDRSPINYFWRPQYDADIGLVDLSFANSTAVPGFLYLAMYLIIVPAVILLSDTPLPSFGLPHDGELKSNRLSWHSFRHLAPLRSADSNARDRSRRGWRQRLHR